MRVNAKKMLALCADRGFQLKDLSRGACVSYRTLNAICRGKPVRVDTIGKLARALKVNSIELVEVTER